MPTLSQHRSHFLIRLALVLLMGIAACPVRAEDPKPIRALLILGGCCHDYKEQQSILTQGLSARVKVQWSVGYDPDTGTKHLNPWYEKENWSQGFDVVIHDECCSDVKDIKTVDKILKPHREGLPAVVLHCGIHSYRTEGYPNRTPWFDFTGLASTGHGPQVPIEITFLDNDNPITRGMKGWTTQNEELYNNSSGRLLDTAQPLATGRQMYKNKDGGDVTADATCVWTNKYNGKTNVFATTLGHNNSMVGDDRYLDLVARGLLWSVGKLDDASYRRSSKSVLIETK